MSKYRVSIVCINNKNGQAIKKQLEFILGNFIDFEVVNCEKDMDSILGSNLVLASGNRAAKLIASFLMFNTDILIIRRTISRKSFDSLKDISSDTKILVVNDDHEMTDETISLFYELGFKNKFIPYYPGCTYEEDIKVAITPNEVNLVPNGIEKIINIGARVIDSATIFDMFNKLGLLNKSTIKIVSEYMTETIPLSAGLKDVIYYMTDNKLNFELTLNSIDYGIFLYNNNKEIIFYNKEIQTIFKINSFQLINQPIKDIKKLIGEINFNDKTNNWTHRYEGQLFLVTLSNFKEDIDSEQGGIITIIEYKKAKKILSTFYNYTNTKGYLAKYTFKSIVGKSDSIKKTIELAENFSKFDSPILIQGESGTGKELFAQSIHNASNRKNGPFVAFNCAALADSLLESELFGYEEGAFTGARKDGKPGLFELANGGSLFLDEIGDISLNFQAKLLRVLQECEFIRVGGIQIISTDTRIISATNKDLNKLVKAGKFREDLYYRINVLPLNIEPFRYRKQDIQSLINYFYNSKNINKDISYSAMEVLLNYDWPGNGREIENCVEYLNSVAKNKICEEDIPKYILDNTKIVKSVVDLNKTTNVDTWVFILIILKEAKINGRKIGRKTISKELNKYSVYITESEVRNIIKSLSEDGLVTLFKGRGGTLITDKGLLRLKEVEG